VQQGPRGPAGTTKNAETEGFPVNPRAGLPAAVLLAPLAALGWALHALGSADAALVPLYAAPLWLLAGCSALAAAWMAMESQARVDHTDVGAFVAPLAALGLTCAIAAAGLLATPAGAARLAHAVTSQLIGSLAAGTMALFALAVRWPATARRPLEAITVFAGGATLALGAVTASRDAQGPVAAFTHPLPDLLVAALALTALAVAARLWRSWWGARSAPATALFATGLTMVAYAAVGFGLAGSSGGSAVAWFGRFAAVAAGFAFLLAMLMHPAPAVALPEPAPKAS